MTPPVPLGILAGARAPSEAPSPVSVIQTRTTTLGANGPQTVNFSATVQPGDKVAVLYFCHRATSVRVISSISGMGATWTGKYTPAAQGSLWLGSGVTTNGNVTITQNAAASMTAVLYLIRGLTSETVTATSSNLNDGMPWTTGVVGGLGQIALHWVGGFDATLAPMSFAAKNPLTNWNFETMQNNGTAAFCSAYRTPGATAMQSTEASAGIGDTVLAYAATLG